MSLYVSDFIFSKEKHDLNNVDCCLSDREKGKRLRVGFLGQSQRGNPSVLEQMVK